MWYNDDQRHVVIIIYSAGRSDLEEEEDTTSVYKLPESKFQEGRSTDVSLHLDHLKMEDPPPVANYDPSR